jgi:hypothetical protein
VNRVFDSSGPEGKVRGTPQQIIDKYNQLARDAQLSGDRVAAENFQQHAEHYLRLLGTAQKEQDAKREEQERQNRERQAERDRERAKRQEREANGGELVEDGKSSGAFDTPHAESDSGLVETPEAREDARGGQDKQDNPPKKPRAPRKPRKPKSETAENGSEGGGGDNPQEAAE